MANGKLDRTVSGYGLSYVIVSLLSAILVVVKESNKETVFEWMKAASGHHWISHGIIVVALFVVLGFVLAHVAGPQPSGRLVAWIVGSTVISGLIIAGYFI